MQPLESTVTHTVEYTLWDAIDSVDEPNGLGGTDHIATIESMSTLLQVYPNMPQSVQDLYGSASTALGATQAGVLIAILSQCFMGCTMCRVAGGYTCTDRPFAVALALTLLTVIGGLMACFAFSQFPASAVMGAAPGAGVTVHMVAGFGYILIWLFSSCFVLCNLPVVYHLHKEHEAGGPSGTSMGGGLTHGEEGEVAPLSLNADKTGSAGTAGADEPPPATLDV